MNGSRIRATFFKSTEIKLQTCISKPIRGCQLRMNQALMDKNLRDSKERKSPQALQN